MRRTSFFSLKLLVALLLVWLTVTHAIAQTVVETIAEGIRNCQEYISLQGFNVSADEMDAIWREVLDENPDLFYAGKSFGYTTSGPTGQVVRVRPIYLFDNATIANLKARFDVRVEAIYERLSEDVVDDFGFLLKTYDFLAYHVAYTYSPDFVLPEELPEVQGDVVYNSAGALIYHQAVCEGYSRALKLLLSKRGMECKILTSESMGHAWNAVKVNGKWYHVDATWGDPTCPGHYDLTQTPPTQTYHYTSLSDGTQVRTGEDFPGRSVHAYFLLTDDEFENHPQDVHTGWTPELSTFGEVGGPYPGAFWLKGNGNSLQNLAVKGNSAYYVEYDSAQNKRYLRKSTWGEGETTTTNLCELTAGRWMRRISNTGFVHIVSGILCFDQLLIFHDATTVYGYDMMDGDLFAFAQPGDSSSNYYINSLWQAWDGKIWVHLTWNTNYVGQILELDELRDFYEIYQQMKQDGYQMASQTTAEPLVALNLDGTPVNAYFGSWLQNYNAMMTCPPDNRLTISVAPCEGAAANAGITLEVYAQEDTEMQNPLASVNGSLADGVGLEYLVEANDTTMTTGEDRSFVVRISCKRQTSIVATQLSAQVKERDFYAVEGVNCVADVDQAFEGKLVTLTATLPEGALVSDYDFTWDFVPAVEFTSGEGTASFEMPAESVSVTCIATLKTYEVATDGCVADQSPTARGETVTLTATLPEGALASDYDYEWSAVPVVEFTSGEGTASFEMPAESVSVTCVATLRTYAIATDGCVADKSPAARGETVTLTASLPEGALVSDYDFTWSAVPAVEFTSGEVTASFEMPAESVSATCVATLRTYEVAMDGCVADKSPAARGETVTLTAVLPEGALVSDYDFTWEFVPAVEFTSGEGTASFEMPAESVSATCVATLKTYEVATDGCVADQSPAARGETVTLTAVLPEGALVSDYDFAWEFVPAVDYTSGEGTASFEMPAESVSVTCIATLKTYEVATDGCVADQSPTARGETVTLTATLPEGANASDYRITWCFNPEVAYSQEGATAIFNMPASAVEATADIVRVYAITAISCTCDVERVAEGESVTLVADLPEGADLADYRITWNFSPEVAFSVDGATATFAMPAEAVEATAEVVRLYAIIANSCTCDVERAAAGESVTLTAILPEGADSEAYTIQWDTEPEVAIEQNGIFATLTMPASDLVVTASVASFSYTLNLVAGWNAVVLGLTPDEDTVERLQAFTPMTLGATAEDVAYQQATELLPDQLYWLYLAEETAETQAIIISGEPFEVALPVTADVWTPYGTSTPLAPLEGYEVWEWRGGLFRIVAPDQWLVPGKGYLLRQSPSGQ